MKDVFALFDIWSKMTDASKAEALEYLRRLRDTKVPSKSEVSA